MKRRVLLISLLVAMISMAAACHKEPLSILSVTRTGLIGSPQTVTVIQNEGKIAHLIANSKEQRFVKYAAEYKVTIKRGNRVEVISVNGEYFRRDGVDYRADADLSSLLAKSF